MCENECAAPEKGPCPEGYVPENNEGGWNPLMGMDGKYFGSYPNIMYPGCTPTGRKLEDERKKDAQRQEDSLQIQQEESLKALLERQKRLETLMVKRQPPVNGDWKPQRIR
mmetsp:Transcript_30550/g.52148  ORF Transcript_30550/g.52148 Transcript_30550/m.52148 type:complete len:111 (+) Transcript_30550:791-1123(+)